MAKANIQLSDQDLMALLGVPAAQQIQPQGSLNGAPVAPAVPPVQAPVEAQAPAEAAPQASLASTFQNKLNPTPKTEAPGYIDRVKENEGRTWSNAKDQALNAITHLNPFGLVGAAANAIGGTVSSLSGTPNVDAQGKYVSPLADPQGVGGMIKQSLALSDLGPGGWDPISQALGLGTLYPGAQPMGGQMAPAGSEPAAPTDYWNKPKVQVEAPNVTEEKHLSNMAQFKVMEQQIQSRLMNPATRTAALADLAKIQDLKNKELANYSQQQGIAKSGRELGNAYGVYGQGTDEKKRIDQMSSGLKEVYSTMDKFNEHIQKSDFASASQDINAMALNLRNILSQPISDELKAELNPVNNQVDSLFHLFEGGTFNRDMVPSALNNISTIQTSLKNIAKGYLDKPSAGVTEEQKRFILNNDREIGSEINTIAHDGLGLAWGKNDKGLYIDPETSIPYLDPNKSAVAMNSGKAAEFKDGKLVYAASGDVVDSNKDQYAAYVLRPDPTGRGIDIKAPTPNEDTFDITLKHWIKTPVTEGSGRDAVLTKAEENWKKNVQKEGGLRANVVGNQVVGVGKAIADIVGAPPAPAFGEKEKKELKYLQDLKDVMMTPAKRQRLKFLLDLAQKAQALTGGS